MMVEEEEETLATLDSKLFDAVVLDQNDMFVKTLKDITRLHPGFKWTLCDDPFNMIFGFDAANCLKAVLDGETSGFLEFNGVNAAVPLYDSTEEEQLVPILHKAAKYGAFEITNLCFPGNEDQLNLRVDIDLDGLKGVQPLTLAVENVARY
ncbi:OLC1v1011673C1 [Oldenlandia corymbosa var. corymbosa]|uniref:OLC1v1011673C1 n=1 Tax=Oldenlandia corymbosa var. corymbosa TaxID=529605 RepID=A0AAV1DWG2_OLDCO|nr:OLC1v1011673C1 [Oldenlandia corymbosa var. corymbosa]